MSITENLAAANGQDLELLAPPAPFVMVIFGATGDLAQHKLVPSLFSLFKQGLLPEEFSIIGFSRREMSDRDLRDFFGALKAKAGWTDFAAHLTYQQGLFEEERGYLALMDRLATFDNEVGGRAVRIFYLATPPSNYEVILGNIDGTRLSSGKGTNRRLLYPRAGRRFRP